MSSTSWFSDRTWSISGNKEGDASKIAQEQNNSVSVIFPKSTNEISELLSTNKESKIAVVCGGHCASNVATWPFLSLSGEKGDDQTIILDMKEMSSVSVNKETNEVKVGGGVLFRQLAETCKEENGALPIGTGDTVGVCGYALNGGVSGYFGKRLGMLSQRVTQLEIVLANGDVKTLSPKSTHEDGDLFKACLGAGSAMGVVTSLTLKMEDDTSFQTGGSLVVACSNKVLAKPFLEKALKFLIEQELPTSSASLEIVVTSDFTVICTFMFYDTFAGVPGDWVQTLRDAAKACNVPVVADGVSSHKSWFDAASSLWEVIGGMEGDPLVRYDHCIGTTSGSPSREVLNFIVDKWVGHFLTKAPFSMVEIRTLGGAAAVGNNFPSGNAKCLFFADMIVSYDGGSLEGDEKSAISAEIQDILSEAKNMKELMVDFSGTHSQSDDPVETLPVGDVIFGSGRCHELVQSVKKRNDPNNRFCFHPFAHLI